MTERGTYGLELDSWLRSQEATERIVREARPAVCSTCGGSGEITEGDGPGQDGCHTIHCPDCEIDGGGFEPLTRGEDADTSTDLQVAPPSVVFEEGM